MLKWIATGGGVLLGAILVVGTYTRLVEARDRSDWTAAEDIPTVSLIAPAIDQQGQYLTLPGTLQAYYDAPIYARVSGYVQTWYKDIGAHVKKGDLLATIDTPELDQQIGQARADLGAAVAAQKLSSTTAERWESLLPLDAVSKQDVEEKEEELASKSGAAKAAEANLHRLEAMKGFARIVAPFDGIVTKRGIDIGALVNAGPASNGDPLFAISDTHALRVYVNVPQSYSAQIVPGMTATLDLPEYPGRSFPARLVSTSGAISRQSSSLLVELEAENAAGLLKAGDYADVRMELPQTESNLRLPASALLFRASGLNVARIGADGHVVLKPITIGTDLGTQVTVASGLSPHDRVINNPPDSLSTGDRVRIQTAADAR